MPSIFIFYEISILCNNFVKEAGYSENPGEKYIVWHLYMTNGEYLAKLNSNHDFGGKREQKNGEVTFSENNIGLIGKFEKQKKAFF